VPADPELKKAKADFLCALVVNASNLAPGISINRGAVDDLQTALVRNGQPTELGKMMQAGILVPTHAVTDVTIPAQSSNPLDAFGVHGDVRKLWEALGWGCNLTPEQSTQDATKAFQAAASAGFTLAGGALKGIGIIPKSIILGALGGAAQAKSLGELAFGEDPIPVFGSSENDRIVLLSSQFGGIPSGHIRGHRGVRSQPTIWSPSGQETSPSTSAAPMTPHSGGASSNTVPVIDLNGDKSPDPVCRMAELLEADPHGPLFYTSTGSPKPLFEVRGIKATVRSTPVRRDPVRRRAGRLRGQRLREPPGRAQHEPEPAAVAAPGPPHDRPGVRARTRIRREPGEVEVPAQRGRWPAGRPLAALLLERGRGHPDRG
jgi:hypothetical protein